MHILSLLLLITIYPLKALTNDAEEERYIASSDQSIYTGYAGTRMTLNTQLGTISGDNMSQGIIYAPYQFGTNIAALDIRGLMNSNHDFENNVGINAGGLLKDNLGIRGFAYLDTRWVQDVIQTSSNSNRFSGITVGAESIFNNIMVRGMGFAPITTDPRIVGSTETGFASGRLTMFDNTLPAIKAQPGVEIEAGIIPDGNAKLLGGSYIYGKLGDPDVIGARIRGEYNYKWLTVGAKVEYDEPNGCRPMLQFGLNYNPEQSSYDSSRKDYTTTILHEFKKAPYRDPDIRTFDNPVHQNSIGKDLSEKLMNHESYAGAQYRGTINTNSNESNMINNNVANSNNIGLIDDSENHTNLLSSNTMDFTQLNNSLTGLSNITSIPTKNISTANFTNTFPSPANTTKITESTNTAQNTLNQNIATQKISKPFISTENNINTSLLSNVSSNISSNMPIKSKYTTENWGQQLIISEQIVQNTTLQNTNTQENILQTPEKELNTKVEATIPELNSSNIESVKSPTSASITPLFDSTSLFASNLAEDALDSSFVIHYDATQASAPHFDEPTFVAKNALNHFFGKDNNFNFPDSVRTSVNNSPSDDSPILQKQGSNSQGSNSQGSNSQGSNSQVLETQLSEPQLSEQYLPILIAENSEKAQQAVLSGQTPISLQALDATSLSSIAEEQYGTSNQSSPTDSDIMNHSFSTIIYNDTSNIASMETPAFLNTSLATERRPDHKRPGHQKKLIPFELLETSGMPSAPTFLKPKVRFAENARLASKVRFAENALPAREQKTRAHEARAQPTRTTESEPQTTDPNKSRSQHSLSTESEPQNLPYIDKKNTSAAPAVASLPAAPDSYAATPIHTLLAQHTTKPSTVTSSVQQKAPAGNKRASYMRNTPAHEMVGKAQTTKATILSAEQIEAAKISDKNRQPTPMHVLLNHSTHVHSTHMQSTNLHSTHAHSAHGHSTHAPTVISKKPEKRTEATPAHKMLETKQSTIPTTLNQEKQQAYAALRPSKIKYEKRIAEEAEEREKRIPSFESLKMQTREKPTDQRSETFLHELKREIQDATGHPLTGYAENMNYNMNMFKMLATDSSSTAALESTSEVLSSAPDIFEGVFSVLF